MEEQIKKLREAGFSDQDIQDWVAEQKTKNALAPNEEPVAPKSQEQDVPFTVTPTAQVPQTSTMESAAHAVNDVNALLSSPVGHVLEAGVGIEAGRRALKSVVGEAVKGMRAPVAPTVTPPTAPTGPVAPAANPTTGMTNQQLMNTIQNSETMAGRAAPQAAAEGEGIMSKLGGLYKQYGPAIGEHFTQAGKAIADSRVGQMAGAVAESPAGQMAGKVLGGVARIAGSAPVQGAMLALHSGGLNEGEDAQLKAIQNSPEYKMQMKQYLELKKKQQDEQNHLKQMSQNVNPNLPNAFTSGYAQQLNGSVR